MKFKWISDAHSKTADCLSQLVDVKDTQTTPTALINMLVTSISDGPATHTCIKAHNTAITTSTDTTPTSANDKVNTPLMLTTD